MIETGKDLKAARRRLRLSVGELADMLRLSQDRDNPGDRIRDMENGAREVTGPVAVAVELFLFCQQHGHWPPPRMVARP